MKLILLYIGFVCVTWMGNYFKEKKMVTHIVKEMKEAKESIPFEMVPANIFIQYNQ